MHVPRRKRERTAQSPPPRGIPSATVKQMPRRSVMTRLHSMAQTASSDIAKDRRAQEA
jgi:hypothetical protein